LPLIANKHRENQNSNRNRSSPVLDIGNFLQSIVMNSAKVNQPLRVSSVLWNPIYLQESVLSSVLLLLYKIQECPVTVQIERGIPD